jgi:hypothetical protein
MIEIRPKLGRRPVQVNNQLFQAWSAHLVGEALYFRNPQALLVRNLQARLLGGLRHNFHIVFIILELSVVHSRSGSPALTTPKLGGIEWSRISRSHLGVHDLAILERS